MRSGPSSIFALGVLLAASLPGCRLPGKDGPIPRSLAISRQLSQRGIDAIEREDWTEAERLLAQAVRAYPSDVDARRHYADALWARGLRQKAIAQLEEANRLTGDDAELYALIAEMRLAMDQPDLAWQNAQRAIDLDPKLAVAWTVRARIARERGQTEQALADYHRALGLAPDDRQVKLAVAELHRQLNQPQRALSVLHSLADSYSPGEEPPEVFYLQGLAYTALGRYDDAVDCYAAASSRGDTTAETLYRLAETQWLAGRTAEAATAAQDALSLDPRHEPSQELLNRIGLAQRRNAPALH
jgi:tetratricopeptide (TPR) repeat protein